MERSLVGKEVCFTGRLASMPRTEAEERTERVGGHPVAAPAASTSYLVMGEVLMPGGRLTRNLAVFKELKEKGSSIELVGEAEFLRLLGAEDELADFSRLYTAAQVSRIAEVSLAEVRAWLRHGLLRPARLANKLPWFEYRDILLARNLTRLSAAGVSTAELKRSLHEISRWLPDGDRIVERLTAVENGLRVRLADGGWADPGGQRIMDFGAHDTAASTVHFEAPEGAWFAKAADAEERGDLEEAVKRYARALEEAEDSVTYFNLGNVLFALGREGEAAERYLSAIGMDGMFVEAWNNLGNSLAALGKDEDAVSAYRKALEIEPDYPDAHCNIAVILEKMGRIEEASMHGAACVRAYPPRSRLRLLKADGEEC